MRASALMSGLNGDCAPPVVGRPGRTADAPSGGACAYLPGAPPQPGQACPFIATQCPGVCVFLSALVGSPMGVILLRAGTDEMLLVNPRARIYLQSLDIAEDGSTIRAALESRSARCDQEAEWRSISWQGRSYEWSDYYLDAGRLYFLADVTERRRYEAIAIRADMEQATARLLSTMRHEIATPASTLQATLSVLLDNYEAFDDEKRLTHIRRCLEQARTLRDILSILRTYHCVDAIEPRAMDLMSVVDRHAQLAADTLLRAGVELIVVPPPEKCLVLAHAQALQQVLSNVTANAVEAIEGSPGGRVRLSIVPGPRYVAVEVSDNGPGIPDDVLPHVFTPLFTTKLGGTGLGLAVVRQMMLRQHGDVELESSEGNGTTVRLLLARAADQDRASCTASVGATML